MRFLVNNKKLIKTSIKVVLLLAAIFALWRAGVFNATTYDQIDIEPDGVLVILGAVLGVTVLGSLRWKMLLDSAGISFRGARILRFFLLGCFYSVFTPGGCGGDLARMLYAARERPGSRTVICASVIVDRVIGLLVMLVVSVSAIFVILASDQVRAGLHRWALWGGGLLLVSFLGLAGAFLVLRSFSRRGQRIFGAEAEHLLALWPRGGSAVGIFLLSIAIQGLRLLVPLAWGRALGDESSAFSWFATYAVAMMLNQIPVTPGGLGVGEFSMHTLYVLFMGSSGANIGALVFFLTRISFYIQAVTGAFLIFTSHNPEILLHSKDDVDMV